MAAAFGAHLIMERYPRSATAEAFRSLRTSLQFLGAEKTCAFVITSPGPGEGKSTCAANLAIAMASAGRRVLLVDGDMRRPSMDVAFGLARVQGLSNILIGQSGDESVPECAVDGLDVLPSGPPPPNPSELLAGSRFDEAITRWSERYDHVIIDSPPVLAVTDAVVIGRRVGHALLVTRAGATRDKALQRTVGVLREAGVNIFGTVLNDLSDGRGHYGYYDYSGSKSDRG